MKKNLFSTTLLFLSTIGMLAQTAMNLGFDGLMVEVHPHPDKAFTDAKQQDSISIAPSALARRRRSPRISRTAPAIRTAQPVRRPTIIIV